MIVFVRLVLLIKKLNFIIGFDKVFEVCELEIILGISLGD